MNVHPHTRENQVSILVVDDEEPIRTMFQLQLTGSGYKCMIAESAEKALALLDRFPFDIIVTDIMMPSMDGIELIGKIKKNHGTDIIVMSGYAQDYAYDKIIELGAKDFIQKPVSFEELQVRIKRVLRERTLLIDRNQQHQELKNAYLDTINRLAVAAEYKDEDTADHLIRISRYSTVLAEKIGLSPEMVENVKYAAPMHDIGKIGIPDQILFKPGRLTAEELEIVKTHTTIGAAILADSKSEILIMAHETALSHHEKWNGSGYPRGLAGTDIPLVGRIVGLVDVFDALTTVRPYKKPYPTEVALEIIRKERGIHTDPEITDLFFDNIDAILEIREEVSPKQHADLDDFSWSDRDAEKYLHLTVPPRQHHG